MEKPKYRVAIISDLHLGEGWKADGHLDRNEDFFFDASFARFLDYLMQEANDSDSIYRLLINGDFVDFLQFTSVPEGGGLDGEPVDRKEQKFGLGTGAKKTCYKLELLFAGHEIFSGHWRHLSAPEMN